MKRLQELGITTLDQARTEEEKWFYESELVDRLVDGLRKAGLPSAAEREDQG